MEVLGILLLLLSIPLALRWVPPNHFYGFRVPAVYRNPSVWYDVNAAWGRQAMALGVLMVALEFLLPRGVLVQTLRPLGLAGLAFITLLNWRLVNRLEQERRR